MSEQAFAPLLKHLARSSAPALWLADENHEAAIPALVPYRGSVRLLSNRYDIARLAASAGLDSQFADWVFPTEPLARVLLRIGKEKAVTHHLINEAFIALSPGGELHLSGCKDEGIKTYARNAKKLFGSTNPLVKEGLAYHLTLIRPPGPEQPDWLDSRDYLTLRPVTSLFGQTVLSKPGVYGWDKVDKGSALLIETLNQVHGANARTWDAMLDLGCGYGYLTLSTKFHHISRRVATDNNAGALQCTRANAEAFSLSVEVVAADCADGVSGLFDLILCNPPFHTGFDVDAELHRRFLNAAAMKLRTSGEAYFVVNSFLPLEKLANSMFRGVECLANDGQFKVIRLTLKKRG